MAVDHTWGPSYGSTLVYDAGRADNGGGFSRPKQLKDVDPWRVITDIDTDAFRKLYVSTMKGASE